MEQLAVRGVHAMLFDDDAAAAFVDSTEALLPWSVDSQILIDRYDIRHLLLDSSALNHRRRRSPPPSADISEEELDFERYRDLQPDEEEQHSSGQGKRDHGQHSSGYHSVPFDYGNSETRSKSPPAKKTKEEPPPFHPEFPVPDRLQDHLVSYKNPVTRINFFLQKKKKKQQQQQQNTKERKKNCFSNCICCSYISCGLKKKLVPDRCVLQVTLTPVFAGDLNPATEKLHQIISGTARFVSGRGGQAEVILRVKQANNPTFGFLMPDHHLHPYFRYLVDHPELTPEVSKRFTRQETGGSKSLATVSSSRRPGDGLSLLGQAYSDDDGDETQSPSPSPSSSSEPSLKVVRPLTVEIKAIKEPPANIKSVIDKMVEFIGRNGKEFEDIVKERDKSDERFQFLQPWHEFHPYYLSVLANSEQTKSTR